MAFTKVKIGKPVSTPKSCYDFNVTFMFGDADNYKDIGWAFFNEEDAVEFANFLQDLKNSPHQRDSLRYHPHRHPSFSKFVIVEEDGMFGDDDEYIYAETAQLEYWPNDVDGWGVGKVDSFSAVYYDERGNAASITFE